MATITSAVNAGPDISRPGQQLLPTYAVKLLKNLKIPFGTDRTMNGVDVDPTIPLLSHIVDCLGALRDVNKCIERKVLSPRDLARLNYIQSSRRAARCSDLLHYYGSVHSYRISRDRHPSNKAVR